MPIAFLIDEGLALTVACWDGRITEQHTIDYILDLAKQADWPTPKTLADMSTVVEFEVGAPPFDLVHELFDNSPAMDPFDRTFAVVRPQTDARRVFDETFKSFPATLDLFDDLPSACTRLGVENGRVAETVAGLRRELRAT